MQVFFWKISMRNSIPFQSMLSSNQLKKSLQAAITLLSSKKTGCVLAIGKTKYMRLDPKKGTALVQASINECEQLQTNKNPLKSKPSF